MFFFMKAKLFNWFTYIFFAAVSMTKNTQYLSDLGYPKFVIIFPNWFVAEHGFLFIKHQHSPYFY